MVARYTPERGDVVWVTFDPTRGHEQRGRRPALIVSPRAYNAASGLAIVCPITSQIKGYPFEVSVTIQKKQSAVLVDQARSLDWKERGVEKIQSAPARVIEEAQEYLKRLLFE